MSGIELPPLLDDSQPRKRQRSDEGEIGHHHHLQHQHQQQHTPTQQTLSSHGDIDDSQQVVVPPLPSLGLHSVEDDSLLHHQPTPTHHLHQQYHHNSQSQPPILDPIQGAVAAAAAFVNSNNSLPVNNLPPPPSNDDLNATNHNHVEQQQQDDQQSESDGRPIRTDQEQLDSLVTYQTERKGRLKQPYWDNYKLSTLPERENQVFCHLCYQLRGQQYLQHPKWLRRQANSSFAVHHLRVHHPENAIGLKPEDEQQQTPQRYGLGSNIPAFLQPESMQRAAAAALHAQLPVAPVIDANNTGLADVPMSALSDQERHVLESLRDYTTERKGKLKQVYWQYFKLHPAPEKEKQVFCLLCYEQRGQPYITAKQWVGKQANSSFALGHMHTHHPTVAQLFSREGQPGAGATSPYRTPYSDANGRYSLHPPTESEFTQRLALLLGRVFNASGTDYGAVESEEWQQLALLLQISHLLPNRQQIEQALQEPEQESHAEQDEQHASNNLEQQLNEEHDQAMKPQPPSATASPALAAASAATQSQPTPLPSLIMPHRSISKMEER